MSPHLDLVLITERESTFFHERLALEADLYGVSPDELVRHAELAGEVRPDGFAASLHPYGRAWSDGGPVAEDPQDQERLDAIWKARACASCGED